MTDVVSFSSCHCLDTVDLVDAGTDLTSGKYTTHNLHFSNGVQRSFMNEDIRFTYKEELNFVNNKHAVSYPKMKEHILKHAKKNIK